MSFQVVENNIALSLFIATQRAKRTGWHTKPIQACEYHIKVQKYYFRTQGPPV